MAKISTETVKYIKQIMSYEKGISRLDHQTSRVEAFKSLSRNTVKDFFTYLKKDIIARYPAEFRKKKYGSKLH